MYSVGRVAPQAPKAPAVPLPNAFPETPFSTVRIFITFLNISHFGGSIYYTLGRDDAYIYDQTNATLSSSLVLPAPIGNGTSSFYLQITGYANSYLSSIQGGGFARIYTAPNTFNSEQILPLGSVFLLTGYATSGNPWANFHPSWTMQTVTPAYIPMKPNIDLYLINTNGYNIVNGALSIPPLVNGQTFRFNDNGGKMGTTRIVLVSTNGVKVQGQNSSVFGWDGPKLLFCNYNGFLMVL